MLMKDDRRTILILIEYCQRYWVRKLMKEFPAKTWKKITLNFLNRLKEIGNYTQKVTG